MSNIDEKEKFGVVGILWSSSRKIYKEIIKI